MGKSELPERRALSAVRQYEQATHWRKALRIANRRSLMKHFAPLLAAVFAAAVAAPTLAAPGGRIDTLQIGDYFCELPGDVTGPVGKRMPAEDFSITNASSYDDHGLRGTYLLTGDIVRMTSGPKNGQRFRRQSSGFLRQLNADGTDNALRCIRRTRNNS
jgi:hypothetical protein